MRYRRGMVFAVDCGVGFWRRLSLPGARLFRCLRTPSHAVLPERAAADRGRPDISCRSARRPGPRRRSGGACRAGRCLLGAAVHRPGDADDHPRPGAVLRRHGAQEERARHHDAVVFPVRVDQHCLDGGRLFAGVRRRQCLDRRRLAAAAGRHRRGVGPAIHPGGNHRRAGADHHPRERCSSCSRWPLPSSPRRWSPGRLPTGCGSPPCWCS